MGKVNIIGSGRSGTIQYIEGWWKKKTYEFYWEFGGGDTIAIIWFPAEDKWNEKYPDARGRRKEIMRDVAKKMRRKQAPLSTIKWENDSFSLVKRWWAQSLKKTFRFKARRIWRVFGYSVEICCVYALAAQ